MSCTSQDEIFSLSQLILDAILKYSFKAQVLLGYNMTSLK